MSLIQMSISAAVMIVFIVLIRALLMNRLPKKTFMVLWGIVLLRLLVPFQIPSALSVYSLAGYAAHFLGPVGNPAEEGVPDGEGNSLLAGSGPGQTAAATGYDAAGTVAGHGYEGIQGLKGYGDSDMSGTDGAEADRMTDDKESWLASLMAAGGREGSTALWKLAAALWAVGTVSCGLFFSITYYKCRQEFAMSLPVDRKEVNLFLKANPMRRHVQVRCLRRLAAPLTYGILRPVILLPGKMGWDNEEQLDYILTHEMIHIRRMDGAKKLFLTAASCIHWFNPLVWVMYVFANRDMELSCDEEVVRRLGENRKSDYAKLLIHMEEMKSGFIPLCNGFSRNGIEERIRAIMKSRKKSLAGIMAAVLLVLGVSVGLATSADAKEGTGLKVTLENMESGEYQVLGKYEFREGDTITGDLAWKNAQGKLYLALGTESGRFNGFVTGETDKGYMKESITVKNPGSYYIFVGNWHGRGGTGEVTGRIQLPLDIQEEPAVQYLKSLQEELKDYGNMTVDEFREKVWKLTDNEESKKLLESLEQDEVFYGMRSIYEPSKFLFRVLLPLSGEKLAQHNYNDSAAVSLNGGKAVIEYSLAIGITDEEKVVTGDYLESVKGMTEGLQEFLEKQDQSVLYDIDTMEAAINAQIERLSSLWGREGLEITSEFVYRVLQEEAAEEQNGGNEPETKAGAEREEEERGEPGTREDYQGLLALMTEGYQDKTVAEFNRELLDWANESYDRMERINADLSFHDIRAALTKEEENFVKTTASDSGTENAMMIRSSYTGQPEEDPGWTVDYRWEDDQSGGYAWIALYGQFTYHLADKESLTVGERDERLAALREEVEKFWTDTDKEEMLVMKEADVKSWLKGVVQKYSDEDISFSLVEKQLRFESNDERKTAE